MLWYTCYLSFYLTMTINLTANKQTFILFSLTSGLNTKYFDYSDVNCRLNTE